MDRTSTESQGWRRHRRALIAVSVVVVILGALLTTAIPRYVNLAQYGKRSEGTWRLEQIRRAQIQYFEQHGEYVAVGATPQQMPGKRQLPFESKHTADWERLGWKPDSMVRCQYEVTVPDSTNFRAVARCDVDGDGKMSVFVSSRDSPPQRTSPDDHL